MNDEEKKYGFWGWFYYVKVELFLKYLLGVILLPFFIIIGVPFLLIAEQIVRTWEDYQRYKDDGF